VNIICHRGFWLAPDEKNSTNAFVRAFNLGLGTETDIRDLNGEIVISHDLPSSGVMTLGNFLNLVPRNLTLALNVKSDGIARKAIVELKKANHNNFFFFDMSIPDMQDYLKQGIPTALRLSEFEPWVEGLTSQSDIVWLDMFESLWYDDNDITRIIEAGKSIYIVSAELHGMDNNAQWELLKPLKSYSEITLCTDCPLEALTYFS
jgi:hypothetical protein